MLNDYESRNGAKKREELSVLKEKPSVCFQFLLKVISNWLISRRL